MAIYYSTGKNPYQRRRGVPCEPFEKVAEKMVLRGYLVRSLEELNQVDEVKPKELPKQEEETENVETEPVYEVTLTKPEKPAKPVREVKPKAKKPVKRSRSKK